MQNESAKDDLRLCQGNSRRVKGVWETDEAQRVTCVRLGEAKGMARPGGGRGGGIEGKARVWRNSCQVVLCGACLFFGGLSSLEIEGGEVVLDSSDECDGGRLVEGPKAVAKGSASVR